MEIMSAIVYQHSINLELTIEACPRRVSRHFSQPSVQPREEYDLVKDSDYSGKIGALLHGSFMNKAKTTTVSQILQHGPKASRYYDPDPQV